MSKDKLTYLVPILFLQKYYGEVIKMSRKFTLGDHIF